MDLKEMMEKAMEQRNKDLAEAEKETRESMREMLNRFDMTARWGTEWCKEKPSDYCGQCQDQLACSCLKVMVSLKISMKEMLMLKQAIALQQLSGINLGSILKDECDCPECKEKKENPAEGENHG